MKNIEVEYRVKLLACSKLKDGLFYIMTDLSTALHGIILEFIEDLKNNVAECESDKGDLMLVEFFFKKAAPSAIMEHVIKHVLPLKDKIKNRNTSFFLQKKNEIFRGLPTDRVEYFAQRCSKPASQGGLSDEDKEVIFAYFDTMIELAEKQKKLA